MFSIFPGVLSKSKYPRGASQLISIFRLTSGWSQQAFEGKIVFLQYFPGCRTQTHKLQHSSAMNPFWKYLAGFDSQTNLDLKVQVSVRTHRANMSRQVCHVWNFQTCREKDGPRPWSSQPAIACRWSTGALVRDKIWSGSPPDIEVWYWLFFKA